jgi:hypothetical protein
VGTAANTRGQRSLTERTIIDEHTRSRRARCDVQRALFAISDTLERATREQNHFRSRFACQQRSRRIDAGRARKRRICKR